MSINMLGKQTATYKTIKEAQAVKKLRKKLIKQGHKLNSMTYIEKVSLFKELSI